MKKYLFAAFALFSAVSMMTSCGSDSNDNGGSDTTVKTRNISIKAIVNNVSDDGTTLSATDVSSTWESGDKIYVFDDENPVGDKISTLNYDASSGYFTGTLKYEATDDAVYAYIKRNNSVGVSVDEGNSLISVSLANQSGTYDEAVRRDLYKASVTPKSMSADVNVKFTRVMAYAKVTVNKNSDVSALSGVALASSKNMYSSVTINMFTGVISGTSGSPNATVQDGGTYIAFYAQTIPEPTVGTKYLFDGKSYILQHDTLTTATYSDDADTSVKSYVFTPAKRYSLAVTTKIKPGDFYCNNLYTPVAVVFNTSNVADGGYTHAQALALADANSGESVAWSTNDTQLKTLQSYFTSTPLSTYNGYETTNAVNGNTIFKACNLAISYADAVPNSSGWYLPSAGQWLLAYKNLGGSLARMNAYITAAAGTKIASIDYWTSSPKSTSEIYYVTQSDKTVAAVVYPYSGKRKLRAAISF